MFRLVRHGRIFFSAVATLVLLDLSAYIVRGVTGNASNFGIWEALVCPALVIASIVGLWRGERELRLLLVGWSFLAGGSGLLVIGGAMFVARTVPVPASLAGMAAVAAWPTLYSVTYIAIGLSLLHSRSLNAFFDHQRAVANTPRDTESRETEARDARGRAAESGAASCC